MKMFMDREKSYRAKFYQKFDMTFLQSETKNLILKEGYVMNFSMFRKLNIFSQNILQSFICKQSCL